ncbi:hypothetical protein [Fibrobacter intestinalis]|uniref:The GLUG motif-containing protein n=1 Tax=Fibrobacter intestinalis TaxID=28122 RepID=A0A1T4M523_9BACT|nr:MULTISPECIES: hypothetical protein [Fibrobacter]PBC73453.1 hypothetical protein BGW94_1057 [Fibrobacter sp. NR9]SJZ62099.1 hypothetical protein SAMN02745108_01138 [Fibrobacter intestinalis]
MQKLKSLFLLLALFASFSFGAAWTGSNSEPENMKKIDGKSFYVITTPEELAWIAAQVNNGNDSINAVLANDIVFGSDTSKTNTTSPWTPIGKDDLHRFKGILDGADFSIYGVYTNGSDFGGLVGVLDTAGIVRNVNMKKDSINGNQHAGGLVAYNYGIVKNDSHSGIAHSVSSTSSSGGIVGNNKGIITDCRNSGDIYAGKNYSDSTSIGGIAGINHGHIENCENTGLIFYRSGSRYSGGIAGKNVGEIKTCTNYGVVKSFASDLDFAGGIASYNIGIVGQCINYGNVVSEDAAGGIVGYNGGSVINSINKGQAAAVYYNANFDTSNVLLGKSNYWSAGGLVAVNSSTSAIVKNSFSLADSIYAPKYKGGVAGTNYNSAQIVNNYYDSDILPGFSAVSYQKSTIVNVNSLTTANMQTDAFAWSLNTSNGTEENSGVWSRDSIGYPVFADSGHLAIHRVIINWVISTSGNQVDTLYTNFQGLIPTEFLNVIGKDSLGNWVSINSTINRDVTIFSVCYEISFVDFAGETLQTDTLEYGSFPTSLPTPSRDNTAQYTYSFKGWNPEIDSVKANAIYTAQYDSTLRSYEISFVDFDGELLQTDTLEYGPNVSASTFARQHGTIRLLIQRLEP